MTKYSATLANGITITRNSDRSYSHCWVVRGRGDANGFSGAATGFASSEAAATRAIASTISRMKKHGGLRAQFMTEIVEAIATEDSEPGHGLESCAKNQAATWLAA